MNIQSSPDNPYTILRIKRKRNEEPLDALVVESAFPRKRTKGGKGVFQFAQTVEDSVWQDEKQQKEIQEQISRLAKEDTTSLSNVISSTVVPPPAIPPKPLQPGDSNRRYHIIEKEEAPYQPKWDPTQPPPVLSAKELEAQKANPDFKMYDAVLDQPTSPEMDPEMEKIMPLLQQYLKMENGPALVTKQTDEDDYVWDIFYHRPGARQDWTQTNTVGTVSGLPPLGNADTDSESEDEVLDEADEDSNAEEYYKNDYPDEEDSDSDWNSEDDASDEFHENSDFDGVVHYDEDGSDHDWRD